MTTASYLRFVGRIRGIARADLADSIDRVVQTCGLGEVIDRVVGHLSKGFASASAWRRR